MEDTKISEDIEEPTGRSCLVCPIKETETRSVGAFVLASQAKVTKSNIRTAK